MSPIELAGTKNAPPIEHIDQSNRTNNLEKTLHASNKNYFVDITIGNAQCQ